MLADLPTAPWFRRLLVSGLILGILLLTFTVLQPFIVPLIWGAILAYVSWPMHLRVLKMCGNRSSVASLITTLIVTVIIVVPLVWLILLARVEALAAYQAIQEFLATKPVLPQAIRDLPYVGAQAQQILDQLASDPTALRGQVLVLMEQSSVEVTRLIGGAGRNIAKLFFAVFSLYFLLRDGPRLMREARAVLEGILGPRVHDYLDAAGYTTQAVVYALMLGALAQGAVAGIGYWIFGVEAPVLMGAVTVLIALVPFGAPMVWGSLAVWALVRGDMVNGVGLILWGLILVSWVDNIVRPLVISNATRMPFLLVVFGVLGGVLAFGLVGLFIGPVLLAVSLAIWREWLEEHSTKEEPVIVTPANTTLATPSTAVETRASSKAP
ncbi:AI-2E family transporter [Steroidobacter sp. S1-65]|uniref:AI-2E family transporter n=1 Tax=Steroidobacter gossypii TaxID=2805490 RepID=A0ABS1WUF0_9GAMM|nr:AI-2E family transporter [Steroidobacter gossypii]MBM0104605.1 AI-2E family transporter [Steroidobacter gossypii]